MAAADFELYRQGLETQLRADVEMLYQAYLTKLRAYETVSRAGGPLSVETLLPPEMALHLPAAPAAAPPPAHQPQAPPRAKAYELEGAIIAAWDKLPEVFDKFDVLRVLEFKPRPATLHRALQRFRNEEVLEFESRGSGQYPTRYRKIATPEGADS